jgi:hypothetical protein
MLKRTQTRRRHWRASHHSVLSHPPQLTWRLGPQKNYAAFLSHYKMEAGMEARYLRDLLQKVLGKQVYLDSQNLRNLTHLFTRGLTQSDVLVLLATKDVLTRPYCLLELWCAQRFDVPIVILDIVGRGFQWSEAQTVLNDLPAVLKKQSGGATASCAAST